MIPLMVQKDYKPQGWRKSSLKSLVSVHIWSSCH